MQLFTANDCSVSCQSSLNVARSKNWRKWIRVMKLTALLIFTATIHVAATGLGQEVTLDLKEAPIKIVFIELNKQTGYNFLFSDEVLATSRPVTIHVKKADFQYVLEKCFANQPLDYLVDGNAIVVKIKPGNKIIDEVPTTIDVKGRLVNEAGEPIAGASVIVKGTNTGTVTNRNGYFDLKNINENSVLVISGVSIESFEVSVQGRVDLGVLKAVFKVEVEETVTVNAGYYRIKERNRTGNIAKVTSVEIEKQPVTSPLMALQGRMAGVEIVPYNGIAGSALKIQIRGLNSIRFDGNYPLFIIDGVPVDSRPLLSASSVVQGGYDPLNALNPANILSIEVLKDADATAIYGSRGANGVVLITTKKGMLGKTSVDLNLYKGIGRVSNRIELLNTQQYLELRREAFSNNNNQTMTTANAPDLLLWDTTRYTDWQEVLLGGTTNITDAQLSISGGGAQTSFRFGGAFHKESTIFPGNFGFTRLNGHMSIKHTSPEGKFGADLSTNYGFNKNTLHDALTVMGDVLNMPPNAPALYNSDGKLNWEPYGTGTFNSTWRNPLAGFGNTNHTEMHNLLFNGIFSYKLGRHISVKTSFGYTKLSGVERLANPINAMDPTYAPYVTGRAYFSTHDRNSWIAEPQILYSRKFNKHKLDIIAGTTFQESNGEYQSISGTGYTSDALLSSISGAADYFIRDDEDNKYRYTALFGRIGYSLKDKFMMNLTGRRDGSSRFGTNNQFGNFGAIGAAWVFSKEKYIQNNLSFLSFGKLRASYGSTGNDNIGDYAYINSYRQTSYPYQGSVSIVPTALFNPDFAWEITRKLEFGAHLGFLRDKINMEASWYRNRSSNQLIQYQLPGVTGFGSVLKNLPATVENTGWEFLFNTQQINNKNFRWESSLNITIPRNKVIEFRDIELSPYASTLVVGQSLSIKKFYKLVGVDPQTGLFKFEDVDNNGIINANDRYILRDMARSLYGGFQNKFQYKSFDLTFLIQFVKQDILPYFPGPAGAKINQPIHIYENRWKKSGDVAQIQQVSTGSNVFTPYVNYTNSTGRLVDGSFLRLKTLTLSCNIPEEVLNRIKANEANIYIQGQNLFATGRKDSFDPETNNGQIPPLRIFTAGIHLNF